MRLETAIALRYLRSKRKEVFISIITVISVLGVAVSVVVLNMTLSIMTGFERELKAKLLDTSAHIVIRHSSGKFEDWNAVRTSLEARPDVVSVSPYSYNQAMISTTAGAHGLLIRGILDEKAQEEKISRSLVRAGSFPALFNPEPVEVLRPDGTLDYVKLPALLLGRSLMRRLGVAPGDAVTVFAPQFGASPQGLIPKLRRFAVVGAYASGLVEYENGLAYTSLQSAQSFFGMGNTVSGLEVMIKDLDKAPAEAAAIAKTLSPEYEIQDWTIPNKPLWDALKLEKRVYFIVLLLLILIASFSIISTLVMVVMEKTRDIAVLKSMGLSDKRVMRIFLTQGAIIGLLGTIVGTIFGILGCILLREYGFKLDEAVFSLSEVPVEMLPENFIVVAVAAFLITAAAGIYPARRAAKLKPADSLRFE